MSIPQTGFEDLHRWDHPSRYTPVIPATPTQSARSQAPFFTKQRLAIYLSALVLFQIVTFNCCLPVVRGKFIDFRAFYAAGYMVRTGHAAELYDYDAERKFQSALVAPDARALPMMALPYSALPFVPLSYLNFKHAYIAWFAVNILLLLLSAAALAPHLPNLVSIWKPAPYLLALSLFPVCIALMMGQISMLLLFIACVSFHLLQRENPVWWSPIGDGVTCGDDRRTGSLRLPPEAIGEIVEVFRHSLQDLIAQETRGPVSAQALQFSVSLLERHLERRIRSAHAFLHA